jgi:integrase
MPKITKRRVDAAHPDGGRYIIWDSQIKGFGVLILPTGVKSFLFNYRTPEGRDRRITIGKHGDWTADQARRRADDLRQAVKMGRDPLGEKAEARNALTVGDVLDRYLASERFKEKTPGRQSIDRGRISRHLRPLLGRHYVNKLTTEDVRRALTSIREGKTAARIRTGKRGLARVLGGDAPARDTIALLRTVLHWAASEGLATSNPAAGIRLGSHRTRETILDGADDYARLFQALDRMEREKRIRASAADAIRVIALTGCRRGEAAGLLWSHVDLKRGLLTLPPKAHKAGHKTGKPRVIGLPAAAQAVIAKQPAGDPDEYVFSPAKGNGALALSKVWRAVRVEAGLPAKIGLHGLRHSLASHMAMGGAAAAEIMTALGHSQLSTAQKYVHWAQDARQALAERAASVMLAGMAADAGGAKVVGLAKGNKQ